MTKEEKFKFIVALARALSADKSTMRVTTLATLLNEVGFRDSYGLEYAGGRGTYTLVHAVYDWAADNTSQEDADAVAQAYTKEDGSYAYEK